MQQDNEHMDQLFRDAAENYPLNTGDNRWDDIAAKLQQPENEKPIPFFQKFRNRFIVLGVLGLLSAAGYMLYNAGVQDGMELASSSSSSSSSVTLNSPESATDKLHNYSPSQSIKGDDIILEGDNSSTTTETVATTQAVVKDNSDKQNYLVVRPNDIGILETTNPPQAFDLKELNSSFLSSRQLGFTTSRAVQQQHDIKQQQPGLSFATSKKQQVKPLSFEASAPKQKAAATKSDWYLRADAGIMETVVDGRWANKPGWLVGATVGKSLNKGWRIESGLSFSRQVLDVSGKSFSLGKIESSMPAGMDLKTVHSVQSIVEVPVMVRKKVANLGNGSQVSAAAGVSVRWLLNEKNDYNMMVNGEQKLKQATYTSNYCYVPASLNLSLAYEKNLKSGSSIVVEPFYQLPLLGTGMGDMKVQQVGVKVGLQKFIK